MDQLPNSVLSDLRSNDARVHPSGHLWVSTLGWKAEPKAGSIYVFREGRFEKIASCDRMVRP
jgi:sugar lactone lactonase YvrE